MKESLLAHIKETAQLSPEQIELALNYFKPMTQAKGTILVREGSNSSYINFVVEGCLRIFFIRDDGQEATRHLAFEGQFATGLASFISNKPSQEYIQAMEDTILLRIGRKDFYYLLNLIPAWEKFYRHYLEQAYIDNLAVFQREITKSAGLRYGELLRRNPEVVMRLPNKIVASYLNMSPETLSRVKSRQ